MLKGKIPSECIKACYNKEKLGDKSNRITSNIRFHQLAKIQTLTKEDGSLPTKLNLNTLISDLAIFVILDVECVRPNHQQVGIKKQER